LPAIAWLMIASAVSLQPDPTVVLGLVERDLTGDGQPETLRVVGVGPTIDNLDATFTIESAGNPIYRFKLAPLTRTVGRRVLSAEQHRARLTEFRQWFFADGKFERPAEFVDSLRVMARFRVAEIPDVIDRDRQPSDTRDGGEIWEEILKSPVTIFTFSPGGDVLVAIGWSAQAGRFYRLLECC
jgi:hypothetical protein